MSRNESYWCGKIPDKLLSYLLFDGEYATDLVRLGMRDADAKRQELIDFFSV